MSAKFKYVDDARKFGKMLEGFMQLANEVESVAALEQQVKEIESRLYFMKSEEEKAKASMTEAKEQLEKKKADGDKAIAKAKESAEEITKDAEKSAALHLANAIKEAQQIIDEANQNARAIAMDHKIMKEKNSGLDAEIKDKEKKVSELNKKLAEFKASLGV